jgi:hypothetical protein
MVPHGGVEPRAFRPVLKTELEARYRGRGAVWWMNCDNCGREFQKTASEVRKSANNFCSRSCSASFSNKLIPRRSPKIRVCAKCGTDFQISRTEFHSRLGYCPECVATSPDIRNMTLAECQDRLSVKGKHPSWKNAHVRIANRLWNKHLTVFPCQNCGYSKHVELAHKRSIQSFPLSTTLGEVNAESNNLVLCRNCHWEYDHGILILK